MKPGENPLVNEIAAFDPTGMTQEQYDDLLQAMFRKRPAAGQMVKAPSPEALRAFLATYGNAPPLERMRLFESILTEAPLPTPEAGPKAPPAPAAKTAPPQ